MHRSRIGVILIDHPSPTYASASAFWGSVVGREAEPLEGEPFASLGDLDGVQLALQETGAGTPVRVHLDVETDDVHAEVARLCALGATVIDRGEVHAILADPGGLLFCVVPVQSGSGFERAALTWV